MVILWIALDMLASKRNSRLCDELLLKFLVLCKKEIFTYFLFSIVTDSLTYLITSMETSCSVSNECDSVVACTLPPALTDALLTRFSLKFVSVFAKGKHPDS